MKATMLLFALIAVAGFTAPVNAQKKAEDKSKRPSPPAMVSQTIPGGAKISIDYSQPSVKGRTIGKDLEPKDGQLWRAGANEATVFEASKAVTIEGQSLPAGKYALFIMTNGEDWTLIFNKTWKTWGAYDYDKNKEGDVLKVVVKVQKADPFAEKLKYTIGPKGNISLVWGDKMISFMAMAQH